MAIHELSRNRWSEIFEDEAGRRFLGPRPRFGYVDRADNITHVVRQGERLWHVAQIYYRGYRRDGNLWWVIADFQPEPILDPTIELAAGSVLILPSRRTLESEIFGADRTRDVPA